jgi:hypothetical protein
MQEGVALGGVLGWCDRHMLAVHFQEYERLELAPVRLRLAQPEDGVGREMHIHLRHAPRNRRRPGQVRRGAEIRPGLWSRERGNAVLFLYKTFAAHYVE